MLFEFQSTLPRGERQASCFSSHLYSHFNPRSREGSDCVCISLMHFNIDDFNPRSREGSDPFNSLRFSPTDISIHAPARGATAILPPFLPCSSNFNPRSREGSDCKNTQTTNIISVYFYLYYIIFVSFATNTAYITITKPSKCRCESPYTFC